MRILWYSEERSAEIRPFVKYSAEGSKAAKDSKHGIALKAGG
jgi:hypothetical protein